MVDLRGGLRVSPPFLNQLHMSTADVAVCFRSLRLAEAGLQVSPTLCLDEADVVKSGGTEDST